MAIREQDHTMEEEQIVGVWVEGWVKCGVQCGIGGSFESRTDVNGRNRDCSLAEHSSQELDMAAKKALSSQLV